MDYFNFSLAHFTCLCLVFFFFFFLYFLYHLQLTISINIPKGRKSKQANEKKKGLLIYLFFASLNSKLYFPLNFLYNKLDINKILSLI
jgi:hypothetical protein